MKVSLGFLLALGCLGPLVSSLPQVVVKSDARTADEEMDYILLQYDSDVRDICNRQVQAEWNAATDTENEQYQNEQIEANLRYAKFRSDYNEQYFKDVVVENYQDEKIRKQLTLVKNLGTAALPTDKLVDYNEVMQRMDSVYQLAEICPFNNQNCGATDQKWTLDPEMQEVLASSEDYEELQYVWTRWREESGKKMRTDYKKYVDYANEAARLNGYADFGELWQGDYDDPNFRDTLERLWKEVEPLYNELHTYVRRKLLGLYGNHMDHTSKMIPAHLLGNMWAQSWVNLYDRVKPFPNASLVDVTAKMKQLGYNATLMFQMSDEFYQSLGLPSSAMSYGPKAVIEKPPQKMVCHASAWDFCDGEDFRIKMCTNINMEDFVTIHHEMGHIMYYILYKDQRQLFRTGATPAFHEAVGDTIALAVSTPKHLQTVGLLDNYADSDADNINALFAMALERVAFLPFGYLIDLWRWDVFSGKVNESQWNSHWWSLREKYQKVYAPVPRSENDFDPGAKYHIPASSQYIAYFLAHILEFQFYRSLCIEAGEYNPNNSTSSPLHKCDFYNSKAAGDKLREGLSLGYSEDWRLALEKLTGGRDISGQALLEYFAPLYEFLKEENKKHNVEMESIIETYNEEYSVACNKQVKAQYAIQVDVGNLTLMQELTSIMNENTKFVQESYYKYFSDVEISDYENEDTRRQLKYLTQISVNGLSYNDFNTLNSALGRMQNIYSSTRLCPYDEQDCTENFMTLDPEIYAVMANSTNYDELLYLWKQWHDKTGRWMKNDYSQYVKLMNKAAGIGGFDDMGELWRSAFEQDNFVEEMKRLWSELKPFYNELHTYVRRNLMEIYGDKMDPNDPNIPAHLLGNMWAQAWGNLYDRIKPFKSSIDLDITKALVAKNYTVKQLYEIANDFYVGLGLPDNSMSYDVNRGAVIEKPTDRLVTCHASAWDFCDRQDYRIKMCTRMNMEDFITIHHEMGHINYYILYKDQPVSLRAGANPGFHEAVGDTIALSVATPKHFRKIGLLEDYEDSYENDINALFQKALDRVAFLPFGLLIDMWRWEVFAGEVDFAHWNKRWWELREEYQKVSAPMERDVDAFDPGAKYHIPFDSQYISYFIAHILDLQLHKALCQEAGEYEPNNPDKPLHNCDIDGSTKAGDRLRAGLSLGRSVHWSEALRAMTGETELKTDALLEYYAPLYEYLKKENEKAEPGAGATAALSTVLIVLVTGLELLFSLL